MSNGETSRFVRLHIDLVVEITDIGRLTGAALDHLDSDPTLADEEREQSRVTVREDPAEALAHLLDPVRFVTAVPGTELAQASWSSEEMTDYDPDAEWDAAEWGLADEAPDADEAADAGDAGGAGDAAGAGAVGPHRTR
ncbi:hypothetical protein [Streptomyces sp. x-80]|uniref:hypothetical protein n=1 Tax=Streptomyces sp. x-80 TaxID=2789282 RepID=UPI0039811520